MECYKIENLSFKYPTSETYAIHNINLTINSGDFITLCGKSGCGKTTLLRMLKQSNIPAGDISGIVYYNGKILKDTALEEQSKEIGFVSQSPENQIVTDKVWHELAFSLENFNTKKSKMESTIAEICNYFGISSIYHNDTESLSGGQKQILNLASVMTLNPSVLILDEPTSQLDPISASQFLQTLKKINNEMGTTIIISEHRLEELFTISDKIIVMDKGEIVSNDTSRNVGEYLYNTNNPMFNALPTPSRVFYSCKTDDICPITVKEGKSWLSEQKPSDKVPLKEYTNNNDIAVKLKNISFRYNKNSDDILDNLNLEIKKGEFFAILGGNGAGKSTLLSVISRINKQYLGKVETYGKTGMLHQNPVFMFLEQTIREEIKDENIIKLCDIGDLLNKHPYDLSGGELQKSAIAKLLMKDADILLLDEPTKGIDVCFKTQLANILKNTKKTIIIVSHDVEFCAKYADRCSIMFDGKLSTPVSTQEFFSNNNFYTTAAVRMSRGIIENAVLDTDIIDAIDRVNQ